jgi:hypothetical protein
VGVRVPSSAPNGFAKAELSVFSKEGRSVARVTCTQHPGHAPVAQDNGCCGKRSIRREPSSKLASRAFAIKRPTKNVNGPRCTRSLAHPLIRLLASSERLIFRYNFEVRCRDLYMPRVSTSIFCWTAVSKSRVTIRTTSPVLAPGFSPSLS